MDSSVEMHAYFTRIAELRYKEQVAYRSMQSLTDDAESMYYQGFAAYEDGECFVVFEMRARLSALLSLFYRASLTFKAVRKERVALTREASRYALTHGLKKSTQSYYRSKVYAFMGMGGGRSAVRMKEASILRWTQRAEKAVNRSFAQIRWRALKAAKELALKEAEEAAARLAGEGEQDAREETAIEPEAPLAAASLADEPQPT